MERVNVHLRGGGGMSERNDNEYHIMGTGAGLHFVPQTKTKKIAKVSVLRVRSSCPPYENYIQSPFFLVSGPPLSSSPFASPFGDFASSAMVPHRSIVDFI